MILSTKDVLSQKKGIAEALGLVVIGMSVLLAAGALVANYGVHSAQASALQGLTQAVTNRAEAYASAKNADLLVPQVPATGRQCSTTTQLCTQILAATPSSDGKRIVLRVQGDATSLFGTTITKDIPIVASDVTHVTAIDADGNNVWANSTEGLQFTTWSVAAGKPSDVSDEDLEGPTASNRWVSVDDRAGIDSKGALWVWGLNDAGQAGTGSTSSTPIKPKRVSDQAVHFRTVTTDDDRGYAIDSNGYAWVWGKNDRGQLGLPTGTASVVKTPTKVTGQRFSTFAIGKDNAFGVSTSGRLLAAGAAQTGLFAGSAAGWTEVSTDTRFKTVAATTAGAVATIDTDGKLAVTGNSYTFTPLTGGVFTTVSLGGTAGYAIGTNGRIYAFGQGTNGQLGLGSTTSASTPTVTPLPKFVSVQGSKTSALAIDVTGTLYYVGKTPSGYVGGTDLPQVSSFTKLLPDTKFRQVATNTGDTAAALVDVDGNVYGMGTVTKGLWPTTYNGPADQPIRMPVPADFSSYTWGNSR